MSLIQEIQSDLLDENKKIGPIFLKLRLLASKLGSEELEEWVKHESEGYPSKSDLPDYRSIPVSYTGTFLGSFGSGIRNAPIPPYLINEYAGEGWNKFHLTQSIAAIDELIGAGDDNSGTLSINSSNLMLLLNGKIYPQYECNSVEGTLSTASLAEIQHAVRSRILELTIQLEKRLPNATEITMNATNDASGGMSEVTTQVFNQVINGNVTSIANSGDNSNFNIEIKKGDKDALANHLIDSGIAETDARELAAIVDSEDGGSETEPFGKKAQEWIGKNLSKAANGTWKIGTSVATKVLTEAALKYYGFK